MKMGSALRYCPHLTDQDLKDIGVLLGHRLHPSAWPCLQRVNYTNRSRMRGKSCDVVVLSPGRDKVMAFNNLLK
jgi:hypothetical protein